MMLVITTWDNTLRTMRTCTMTRMDLFGAEWRCVLEGGMGQCVMTSGTMRMPLWSADSWDSPPTVSKCNESIACEEVWMPKKTLYMYLLNSIIHTYIYTF